MVNALLNNKSLENFAKSLDLPSDDKSKILEKIPVLDEEERINLLKVLVEIHFLGKKQEQSKMFLAAWKKFVKDPNQINFQELEKIKKEVI